MESGKSGAFALSDESELNLKKSHDEAKILMRSHQKNGRYGSIDLVHAIRKAAWLSELLRASGPRLTASDRGMMQANLLRTLATAEIAVSAIMGDPFATGAKSS